MYCHGLHASDHFRCPDVAFASIFSKAQHRIGLSSAIKQGWTSFWQIPLVSIGAATAAICSNNLLDSIFSEQCPAAEESSSISVHLSVIFAFIAYLLVGPFLEELVFRRILMGYFDTIMPVALSIGLSSLLFGLVHISPPIIIYATLLGLGSALFTRWQGTLWGGLFLNLFSNALITPIVLIMVFA